MKSKYDGRHKTKHQSSKMLISYQTESHTGSNNVIVEDLNSRLSEFNRSSKKNQPYMCVYIYVCLRNHTFFSLGPRSSVQKS